MLLQQYKIKVFGSLNYILIIIQKSSLITKEMPNLPLNHKYPWKTQNDQNTLMTFKITQILLKWLEYPYDP